MEGWRVEGRGGGGWRWRGGGGSRRRASVWVQGLLKAHEDTRCKVLTSSATTASACTPASRKLSQDHDGIQLRCVAGEASLDR